MTERSLICNIGSGCKHSHKRSRHDCHVRPRKRRRENMESDLDPPSSMKILVVGDCGVGKSTLLWRFADGLITDADIKPTVGVDYKMTYVRIGGEKVKIALWEVAGAGRFQVLTPHYYKGAHGVIFVYDACSRSTFEKIPKLLEECDKYASSKDIVKLLIGNRNDSGGREVTNSGGREVTRLEGVQLAWKHTMFFLEGDFKGDDDIECAINELAERIFQTPGLMNPGYEETKILASSQTSLFPTVLVFLLFSVVIFL